MQANKRGPAFHI